MGRQGRLHAIDQAFDTPWLGKKVYGGAQLLRHHGVPEVSSTGNEGQR